MWEIITQLQRLHLPEKHYKIVLKEIFYEVLVSRKGNKNAHDFSSFVTWILSRKGFEFWEALNNYHTAITMAGKLYVSAPNLKEIIKFIK